MDTGKYLFGTCAVVVFLVGCHWDARGEKTVSIEMWQRIQVKQPQLTAKLQALWKQGAAAKQHGDYAGASRAWRAALALDPGNSRIQKAIDKLPKVKKRRKQVIMVISTPLNVQPGDIVVTSGDIRRYDIVCWERIGKHKILIRVLSAEEAATYKGRKYQIDKGDKPGTFRYIEVK